MHIKVQLKNLIIGFAVFMVVFIGLCIAVGFGIKLALSASALLKHTGQVLVAIREVDKSVKSATNAGRILATGERDGVDEQRANAISKISDLRRLVSDNPVQVENCNRLEQKVRDGFAAQDKLYSTATVDSRGKFQIDESARQISMKANDEVAIEFFTLRETEQTLLMERQEAEMIIRWRVIKWVVFTVILVLVAVVALFSIAVRSIKRAMVASGQIQAVNEKAHNPELQKIVDYINEAKIDMRLTIWNLFMSL